MKKKKIAIVRGPALSKWEMQIYEPLTKWFDIIGIGTKKPTNDISGITFPVIQLFCPGQYITKIPKSIPAMFKLAGDTQWLFGFQKAIASVDLVHSVEMSSAYTVQAVRAKRQGLVKAVTLTVYENIPFIFDEFNARKRLKEEVISGADHFLAANGMARQALFLEGVEEGRISIVPQSVDTKVFKPVTRYNEANRITMRRKFRIGKDDFLVLSAGRMVWEKGWYDIVPTAVKIKREIGKKIKFLFIGEGPEKKTIKDLIDRAGVSDIVVLPGLVPYKIMPDIFRTADIFLYPSLPTRFWNAQFGGVLIEAMATGLPIVGTLCGGTRDDTVGPGGGIFVQPQHFSGLVDAIVKLYNQPQLMKKIGQRNRKIAVEKYDVQVVAKQIRNIWFKVLDEKN